MDVCSEFRRQGFYHFSSVFDADQIAALRTSADRITAEPTNFPGDCHDDERYGTTRSDIFCRFPELRWLLTEPRFVNSLKQILGDPVVFIPEQSLHKGYFARWHRDTDAPRRDGQDFYLRPSFNIVQVAVYLQDNSPLLGGGLDVVPGSHQEVTATQERLEHLALHLPLPFNRGHGLLHRLATYRLNREMAKRQAVTVPIRAGDVVAFNIKMRHRATPRAANAPADARQKYGLFLVCSADNEVARAYVRYIRDVRKYDYFQHHEFDDTYTQSVRQTGAVLL